MCNSQEDGMNVGTNESSLPVASVANDLLHRIRFPTLLLAILSLLGSVGSVLGVLFAGHGLQRMIVTLSKDGLHHWHPETVTFILGMIHGGAMTIAYAVVTWQLLHYAKALRLVANKTTYDLQALFERQHALFISIVYAGCVYVVLRIAGAIIVTIVNYTHNV